MGRDFREVAHTRAGKKKYDANYDKISGKKKERTKEKKTKKEEPKEKK